MTEHRESLGRGLGGNLRSGSGQIKLQPPHQKITTLLKRERAEKANQVTIHYKISGKTVLNIYLMSSSTVNTQLVSS